MKVLKLRFKNINSFYGKLYTLDFTRPPLSDTGLFIISGPTGAGKSTLLDVITLALYNEVPRFEKGVSKTEIDKLGSVVNTKAADEPKCEAYAEVEYEVKSGRYRASWSIAKNRNGNWNNYRMEIAELPNETLLSLKGLSDYPRKNTELIGLNYNQFVKSIVLAQGSFAEFLKADRHTRAKLLEDITGTHIYRRLGEEAYERFKESAGLVKLKEVELTGVELKSEAELAEFMQQKSEKEALCEKAEKEREKWDKEKKLVADIRDLEKKEVQIKAEKVRLEENRSTFEKQRSLLVEHESVRRFVVPMTRLKELYSQYTQLEVDILSKTKHAEDIQERKNLLLVKGEKLTRAGLTERDFSDKVTRYESEVLLLISEINEQRVQAKPVAEMLKEEVRKVNDSWGAKLSLIEYEKSLEVLELVKADIGELLSRYPVDFEASEKLKSLDQQVAVLSELKGSFTERLRLENEGRKMRTEIEELAKIEQLTEPALNSAGERLTVLRAAIEKKTEALIDETTRQSLEGHRSNLKKGEPCPLCGSTSHPFLQHYVSKVVGLGEEISSMKKDLLIQEREEKQLVLRLEGARQNRKELNRRLADMRVEYKQVGGVIKRLSEEIKLKGDASYEDLNELLNRVQEEKAEIDSWGKCREQMGVIERMGNGFNQLVAIRDEVKRLDRKKNEIYAGESIQAEVKELLRQWGEVLTNSVETKEQLAKLEEKQRAQKQELDMVESELQTNLEKSGIASVEEAGKRLLSEEAYLELKTRDDKLREEAQRITVQESEIRRLLVEKRSERGFADLKDEQVHIMLEEMTSAYKKLLEEVAGIRLLLQTEEVNRQRFHKIYEALEVLKSEHRKWDLLARYIGDASGNKFSSFAQSLTLNNLISLANARLLNLSDRYILDKPRNDSDGLFVLDTYHGNQARAVSTLSGGETFTVSLALALALSDLASRNVRIESLFIDEGFGTLDAESLESAVAILERLQQESSKTVGVISHRQEMKERIPVQIQVEKGMDGTSSIRIVG